MKKRLLVLFLLAAGPQSYGFHRGGHVMILANRAIPIANSVTANFYWQRMVFDPPVWREDPASPAHYLAVGNSDTDAMEIVGLCFPGTSLKGYYGQCPKEIEQLHANRYWVGMNDMSHIDSAWDTCNAVRKRIEQASLRAIQLRRAADLSAFLWVGHATHIIEDSFSPGHTRRDGQTLSLLDHCTASQEYRPLERKSSLISKTPSWKPACAHSDEGFDVCTYEKEGSEWLTNEAQAAVFADVGYLLLMKELLTYSDAHPQDYEQHVRDRLTEYFEKPSFQQFVLPEKMRADVPTVTTEGNRISGYFTCDRLKQEVPVAVRRGWKTEPYGDWTWFTGFRLAGKAAYVAYKKDKGDLAIDLIEPNQNGQMAPRETYRGKIEKGWSLFMPFEVNQQVYLMGYRSQDGATRVDRVPVDGKSLSPVAAAGPHGWVAGLTTFVPETFGGRPFAIAYRQATGRLYVAALSPAGSGQPVEYLGVLPGFTVFAGFRVANQPYALFYNASTGVMRIASFMPAEIQKLEPNSPAVLGLKETNWGPGWDAVLPFTVPHRFGSETRDTQYFLKHGNGLCGAIDEFLPFGNTTVTVRRGDWTAAGPVRLALLPDSTGPYYLAYYESSMWIRAGPHPCREDSPTSIAAAVAANVARYGDGRYRTDKWVLRIDGLNE